MPGVFLMNVFVRDKRAYWMGVPELGRSSLQGGGDATIASGLMIPSRVVVDSGFAYFSNYQGLWQVRRDATGVSLNGSGGGGTRLMATLWPFPRRLTEIAVDSKDVYWTSPPGLFGPAQLQRTPVAGGSTVKLATLTSDDDWPLGLAVDDSHVYFTSNSALQRANKADGVVQQLESIGAHISYDAPHPMLGIALDRGYAYFDAGRELRRFDKETSTSEVLYKVPAGDELRGVVVDADYAYFGTQMGDIFRVPKLGGAARLMVSGESSPLVTAIDATSVYWVEQDLGRVRKVSK